MPSLAGRLMPMRLLIVVRLLVVAVVLLGESAAAQPRPEKRVALVIGIENYVSARKLRNPVRDARTVEAALKGLGFTVMTVSDLSRRRLAAALEDFAEDSKGADVALVYFAGHGVEIGGRNHLLPTDANAESVATLTASSLPLEQVFARVAEIAPRRIILLDACRDDPFAGRAVAGGRGVVSASPDAPEVKPGLGRIGRADGTIYAFATAPGATAADGDGDNGPFASALAAHLGKPGLEFRSVMTLVQMEVYDKSRGRQTPYVESALADVFFADTKGAPLPERERLLLAMARIGDDTRAQVERIAKAHDIPLAPLYGSLVAAEAQLGAADFEALEKHLGRAAQNYVEERNRLRTLASSDPQVAMLRAEAETQLSLGAFEAARVAITKAFDIDQSSGETLEALLKERNLSAAESLVARAGIARQKLDYRAAAADFGRAAQIVERWDKHKAWVYMTQQAHNLIIHGDDFGYTASLFAAVDAYRQATRFLSGPSERDDWAITQVNIGYALWRLGERENGVARLEEAEATLGAVLADWTRHHMPLERAAALRTLGNVLLELDARQGGVARLEKAIATYREALEDQTRETSDLDWAATQNSLGSALLELARHERGTERLEEAVATFRAALTVRTRERAPGDWAQSLNNLGNALRTLVERNGDVSRLEEAIAAYHDALSVRTREKEPMGWAVTQNNLGTALLVLGEHGSGTEHLEQSVAALELALTELTRERFPLAWAAAQTNLGNSLRLIGLRGGGPERLARATAAYREALKERTRERVPLDWASVQNNLANVLVSLAVQTNEAARFEESIAAYREALKEYTRERTPVTWAVISKNLGIALYLLGSEKDTPEPLDEAVAAFDDALKEYTREQTPLEWALVSGNKGSVFRMLAEHRKDVGLARRAIEQTERSLEALRAVRQTAWVKYYENELKSARETVEELEKK